MEEKYYQFATVDVYYKHIGDGDLVYGVRVYADEVKDFYDDEVAVALNMAGIYIEMNKEYMLTEEDFND